MDKVTHQVRCEQWTKIINVMKSLVGEFTQNEKWSVKGSLAIIKGLL